MHSRLKCKTKQKFISVRKKTLVPKVKLKNKQTKSTSYSRPQKHHQKNFKIYKLTCLIIKGFVLHKEYIK